ncbi:GAF domain-containing protein [Rhizobium sp. NTR19]|uniref:histidine kinase n=1 Tax=Neorhizobium turbinariae TaxID=2937795 RepID=A0ABT0INK3_9HYPH|nr:HWE histidine kinase domain-containing protein [Neorhizobium turbinariae]MCK8779430.1 GAF domain-containing protein [Neorhizobium turbinariae]
MPQAGIRVFERLPTVTIEPRTGKAFAFAVICSAAALGFRAAIGMLDPAAPPFPAFLVATMITAIVAGSMAGLVGAVLGLVLAWLVFVEHVPEQFSVTGLLQYALISGLIIWISDEYRRLLRRSQERQKQTERQMRLISAENDTLTLIAEDKPLAETLSSVARTIEVYSDNTVLASVLLLDDDGKRLRHCAAPSLPDSYNQAIDGLEIGPSTGSCGSAAFRAQPVYVADVETAPEWEDFRALARQHQLRACWSTPIMSRMNTVLGTFAVYHREPRSPESRDIEIVTLLVKIASLAIERERSREQRHLLLQELAHRMKNSFAVVSAIASNTLRRHVEKSRYSDFEQRLTALARVQSLLTQTNWTSVRVHDLVDNLATSPFRNGSERFKVQGPDVRLPSQLILPFALSIHELCTNATKYGALSNSAGEVEITWRHDAATDPEQLVFRWVERNGPPVAEPARKGFGSRMIKMAFAKSVGGDVAWHFKPGGVECEIRVPYAALSMSGGDHEVRKRDNQADTPASSPKRASGGRS